MVKYFVLLVILLAGISYFSFRFIKGSITRQATVPHQDSLPVNTESPPHDSLSVTGDSSEKTITPWSQKIALNDIVTFAESLKGTPYLYASSDPARGFDCSGFITYVFNHFGLQVPRSSVEFTNRGIAVPLSKAKRGDLILFKGTDSLATEVGHMGIVTENTDSLRFIHSSSGKADGVTVTALNAYYLNRFVKVIAIDKGL
ncbi:hypothetical protein A8C56_20900 [Niabella ginsenosidivorans]|uniref:NlpC/P60 domain-containing protein n=1 Tax=Niabella ginsenosidivorans TaxID=1176587 RepID=A0A1A9I8S0_9BACT|nr:C40 family peptidase [Niabella ginsenosidivorans]ANH83110.1 hypothetical protein A8C56_20900 [Niabella ginsenosidivorans]